MLYRRRFCQCLKTAKKEENLIEMLKENVQNFQKTVNLLPVR